MADFDQYMLSEYEYCDSNIKFIHEQRDRWIRYYIGLIGALQGIPIAVVTVLSVRGVKFDASYFRPFLCASSLLLYGIGVLVFMTCVYARCRTTEFTNELNRIRGLILAKSDEGIEKASSSVLPTETTISAYQVTGADFFRHLAVMFLLSLFVSVLIMTLLGSFTGPAILLASLGFFLSVACLLYVRRYILISFDKILQERLKEDT